MLDCGPLEFEALNNFPDPPLTGRDARWAVPLWLCMDEVMDPVRLVIRGSLLVSFYGRHGEECSYSHAPLPLFVEGGR